MEPLPIRPTDPGLQDGYKSDHNDRDHHRARPSHHPSHL